jgi:hypothetical protein
VFVADDLEGRRPLHHLREAMTTSDFPLLFADILDRQLLANYEATVPTWQNFCASRHRVGLPSRSSGSRRRLRGRPPRGR